MSGRNNGMLRHELSVAYFTTCGVIPPMPHKQPALTSSVYYRPAPRKINSLRILALVTTPPEWICIVSFIRKRPQYTRAKPTNASSSFYTVPNIRPTKYCVSINLHTYTMHGDDNSLLHVISWLSTVLLFSDYGHSINAGKRRACATTGLSKCLQITSSTQRANGSQAESNAFNFARRSRRGWFQTFYAIPNFLLIKIQRASADEAISA